MTYSYLKLNDALHLIGHDDSESTVNEGHVRLSGVPKSITVNCPFRVGLIISAMDSESLFKRLKISSRWLSQNQDFYSEVVIEAGFPTERILRVVARLQAPGQCGDWNLIMNVMNDSVQIATAKAEILIQK